MHKYRFLYLIKHLSLKEKEIIKHMCKILKQFEQDNLSYENTLIQLKTYLQSLPNAVDIIVFSSHDQYFTLKSNHYTVSLSTTDIHGKLGFAWIVNKILVKKDKLNITASFYKDKYFISAYNDVDYDDEQADDCIFIYNSADKENTFFNDYYLSENEQESMLYLIMSTSSNAEIIDWLHIKYDKDIYHSENLIFHEMLTAKNTFWQFMSGQEVTLCG